MSSPYDHDLSQSPLSRPWNWALHRLFWEDARRNTQHLRGRCLDLGCGSQPYRALIEPHVTSYVPVDYDVTRGSRPPLIRMTATHIPFSDASFDSAVCFQVLEHIPQPWQTLAELHRVLRPGGVAYLTTPFLWMVHEEPYDFFRYTEFGLRSLLESAGFEIMHLNPLGGAMLTIVMHLNYFIKPLYGARLPWPLGGVVRGGLRAFWWADQRLAQTADRLRPMPYHATAYSMLVRKSK